MSQGAPVSYEITNNDLRELKRVFDYLADFTAKHKVRKQLVPKEERRAKILMYKKNPDAVKIVDEFGQELPAPVIEAELQRLESEIAQHSQEIAAIDSKPDEHKRITHKNLMDALNFLGKQTDKAGTREPER